MVAVEEILLYFVLLHNFIMLPVVLILCMALLGLLVGFRREDAGIFAEGKGLSLRWACDSLLFWCGLAP